MLIIEKEPGLPSAPDIGLSALQTFLISHIYALIAVLKEAVKLINTEQNNKSSPGLFLDWEKGLSTYAVLHLDK